MNLLQCPGGGGFQSKRNFKVNNILGWLCFTSHRQQGHLETASPFTVPCKGRVAR